MALWAGGGTGGAFTPKTSVLLHVIPLCIAVVGEGGPPMPEPASGELRRATQPALELRGESAAHYVSTPARPPASALDFNMFIESV